MRIIRESYLAAAEPSWANRITEWQLLGVLNLSAILTPRVFLSDVHLGDNLHIFSSYRGSGQLYRQIVELAQRGVVCPMLRDRTIRPQHSEAEIRVDSFEDVFRSWRQLDKRQAWINQDQSAVREEFFRALDRDLKDAAIRRYDYADVKARFMHDTRVAASAQGATWFTDAMHRLTRDQRSEYDSILRREWFSLSDIYAFLQATGIADVGLSALLAHGLVNESAYSTAIGCNLTGYDTESAFVQERIWRLDPVATLTHHPKVTEQEVSEHAATVLDSPSLSILALLNADEIVSLRELGRSYFDFAEHSGRAHRFASEKEFQREFIFHAKNYWGAVCDFVSRTHAGSARKPRRIAVFFNQLPGPLSRISEQTFRFVLTLGAETAVGSESALALVAQRLAQFVFLTETEEMEQIRRMLPIGVWSRETPDLLASPPDPGGKYLAS